MRWVGILLIVGVGLSFSSTNPQVGANDFRGLYDTIYNWMTGYVGKILAVLAIAIGVFLAVRFQKLESFVNGLIIALLAGGAIGIASLLYTTGSSAISAGGGWAMRLESAKALCKKGALNENVCAKILK